MAWISSCAAHAEGASGAAYARGPCGCGVCLQVVVIDEVTGKRYAFPCDR